MQEAMRANGLWAMSHHALRSLLIIGLLSAIGVWAPSTLHRIRTDSALAGLRTRARGVGVAVVLAGLVCLVTATNNCAFGPAPGSYIEQYICTDSSCTSCLDGPTFISQQKCLSLAQPKNGAVAELQYCGPDLSHVCKVWCGHSDCGQGLGSMF